MKVEDLLKKANENKDESSIAAAEKTFAGEDEAVRVFGVLQQMMSSVVEWNAHSMMTAFELFDARGARQERQNFKVGDFIKISLKGALKDDWIEIVNIHEAAHEFVLTVKPTFDPTAEKRDETVISHFFTDEARNNFCVLCKNKKVGVYVIGLREKMNTEETGGALEVVHNAFVNLGSYLGMQTSEWEKFCHHLLEDAVARTKSK